MIQSNRTPVCGTPFYNSCDAEIPPHFIPPSVSNVRPPPPAVYASHTKRYSEGQRTDVTRVQNSFSSADTESSNRSYKKYHGASSDLPWSSPTAERTVVCDEPRHSPQLSSLRSSKIKHAQRRSEMAERTCITSTHIHEQRIGEVTDEVEDDHALWILVCL